MKHEPELDDYTPDNILGARPNTLTVLIAILVIAGLFALWVDNHMEKAQDDHIVTDTTTVSTAERHPIGTVYVKTETRYFYPGDIVTSKENGAMILWDSLMHHKSLIVGIISDSGTVEQYRHE